MLKLNPVTKKLNLWPGDGDVITNLKKLTIKTANNDGSTNGLIIKDSTDTELLRVTDQGRLGIAENNPTEKLHIVGNILSSNFTTETNNNVIIHSLAMPNVVGGISNVAIGADALKANVSGNEIVAIGYRALEDLAAVGDGRAVGIGAEAARSIQTSTDKIVIAIGYQSLRDLTTTFGAPCMAIGYQAARNASYPLFAIGYRAGYVNQGADNVFLGPLSGNSNTTGVRNFFAGESSGRYNVTGSNCAYIGGKSGRYQLGSSNLAIGYQALAGAVGANGSSNVAIGYEAGKNVTSGSDNFLLGGSCAPTLITGSNNFILGNNIDVSLAGTSNYLSINDVIYGNLSLGYIGIGVSSPDRKFHVEEEDAGTNTIVYTNRKSHLSSGMPVALFGVGEEDELEDSAGNAQVASERTTLWADAASGSESPLIRESPKPQNGYVGHRGLWSWDALDNTLRTVVPNGANDVAEVGYFTYLVKEITGGGTSSGSVEISPGGSNQIYNDGTDIVTLSVAADGSVTIQRTGGADTFKVVLNFIWIT